jgi:hypothetical protein
MYTNAHVQIVHQVGNIDFAINEGVACHTDAGSTGSKSETIKGVDKRKVFNIGSS